MKHLLNFEKFNETNSSSTENDYIDFNANEIKYFSALFNLKYSGEKIKLNGYRVGKLPNNDYHISLSDIYCTSPKQVVNEIERMIEFSIEKGPEVIEEIFSNLHLDDRFYKYDNIHIMEVFSNNTYGIDFTFLSKITYIINNDIMTEMILNILYQNKTKYPDMIINSVCLQELNHHSSKNEVKSIYLKFHAENKNIYESIATDDIDFVDFNDNEIKYLESKFDLYSDTENLDLNDNYYEDVNVIIIEDTYKIGKLKNNEYLIIDFNFTFTTINHLTRAINSIMKFNTDYMEDIIHTIIMGMIQKKGNGGINDYYYYNDIRVFASNGNSFYYPKQLFTDILLFPENIESILKVNLKSKFPNLKNISVYPRLRADNYSSLIDEFQKNKINL